MYVTLAQKDLKVAVSAVQTIAGTGKTQLPILKHLLLVADATGMTLSASNEETSLQYRVAADVQVAGTLLLPAHLFSGFVQDLPAAPMTLQWPSPTDATAVQLRCQQVKANLKRGALPVEEFPQVPQRVAGSPELLTIDCELFREIIEQIAFAASTDASRPALEGIRVALENGHASFGAADAFRLALRGIAIPDPTTSAELLLPAQALRQVARLLPSSGALRMALSPSGHQVLLWTKELCLSTRLIEGAFPQFRQLLETRALTQVVLPTHVLREAVQVMAPFARENAHQVRLLIQREQPGQAAALILEADAPDLGTNEIRLTEGVSVMGAELHLQVNDRFFSEVLAAVPTPQIALECTAANRPIRVRPVGSLDCVYVIMPLIFQKPAMPVASSPVPQESAVASAATRAA